MLKIIADHEVCDQQLRAANKRADKAEQDRNHWHDKAQEYRNQRINYRKARDNWRAEAKALPRVITADELKEGQLIVAQHRESKHWHPPANVRRGMLPEDNLVVGETGYYLGTFSQIVLLADAPDTKDINVAKETVEGEYPDNPWFATVYEDATYLADPWRGTPVRPQSIRAGDLYDIHTAHGTAITGVVAARNGVRNPQSGDMYRLITRKA